MRLFGRKRTLIEIPPDELSIELLNILYGSLMAKLVLVSHELECRYRNMVALGSDLEGVNQERDLLTRGADRLAALSLVLQEEIAQGTKSESMSSGER